MEFGEQLAPPTLHMASSSTSSSSVPPKTPSTQCSGQAPSPSDSSSLNTCGHLLQMMGDERLKMSGISSGFPAVGHPGFGLYTSSSGHPECGDAGSFGFSALAAHSQLGPFSVSHTSSPDWWRESETHTRGTAAFFPPLLNLHPAFASTLKGYDPSHLQSSVSVGVSGTMSGRSTSPPTGSSAVKTKSLGTMEKSDGNSSQSQTSSQEMCQQHQRDLQKTKEKKLNKRQLETSSLSSSQSGSLSDSSSVSEDSSSDSDDTEDDGNEEDAADQSNDTEDSEKDSGQNKKVNRLTQNTSESKNKRPSAADGNVSQDSHCDIVPLTSSYRLQSSFPHPAGETQSAVLFLQSSTTAKDKGQQHISVIHATGSAAKSSPLAGVQSHGEVPPLPSGSSPKLIFSTSPTHLTHSSPPKPNSVCPSPKPLAVICPSKPISLSSSPMPFSISSLTKPSTLFASHNPQHKPKLLTASPNRIEIADVMMENSTGPPDGRPLHLNSFLTQSIHSCESAKQAFSGPTQSQNCSDTNLFLIHHPNGVVPTTAQDAPLALITRPRSQGSTPSSKPLPAAISPPYPMPINLKKHSKKTSGSFGSVLQSSASSDVTIKTRKSSMAVCSGKSLSKSNLAGLLGASATSSKSEVHSWRDSDDTSGEDHEDDDDDDNDDLEAASSGSSLSESESNVESDSDGLEDDVKEHEGIEVDSDTEKTPPLKFSEASSSIYKSPSKLSSSSFLPSQRNINTPSSPGSLLSTPAVTGPGAPNKRKAVSPPVNSTTKGSGKRRRVTDETILHLPLEFGWRRETRIRAVAGRLQGEVTYFAPCGKKLRQYPDVMKYLLRNGITEISRDNFSYSTKIKVGDFYEARDGPEGLQWVLLTEEEIAPTIIAMDGRRSRCAKSEHQLMAMGDGRFQDVNNAKLIRKLEAQEIARQAAQLKLMRKLEKQAMLQAAKEARRQQAIMAAEERRKKREQMKLLKQQEKIKRIQQIRMERELRAQQILEERKRKKEEAANAKLLETEKRNKEREMRRLQAVILKKQELERHRLDMERERRRQHMMLTKAMEARKRAEEKERLKREKNNERHLSKLRRLELKRLELEMAKELKKPNEDMCLADLKPLPKLSRIPGLILPAATFSDCLMVLQFLHSFCKVLRLDFEPRMLSLGDLQEGLLNISDNMGRVQDLLVSMLSVAVNDPGMPAGHKNKTLLGDNMTSVHINRDNVSEILQIYMSAQCEQTELAPLALSLRTKAFQAHSPSQKASILAFLVNELCCSKVVISEIDKNIEQMTNLRKDKMMVDKKLRTLRNIHAKKTGKKDTSMRREDSVSSSTPTVRNKCKRKEGDSDEEEDEEDDSEDQRDDEEEEEEESGGKKEKKTEICDEEDDSVQSATIEELEKLIEKTHKQQSQIKQKLFDSSQLLRSMTIGQDRYRRHYWVLPRCGGIFVEGMESNEGYEEVEKEKIRQMTAQVVKEEQQDETKPVVCSPTQSPDGDTTTLESQQDKDALNLFPQKPSSSSSKLSKLLEVAKMVEDSDKPPNNSYSATTPSAASTAYSTAYSPSYSTCQTDSSPQRLTDKTSGLVPSPLRSSPWITCSPQSFLQEDHYSKIMAEKSSQWFSLFPRSPCDESSVTSGSSPANSASSPLPIINKSPSSRSPYPQSASDSTTPSGIKSMQLPVPQQVKSDTHQSRLTLCDMPNAAINPTLPFSGTSPPPELDVAFKHAEGDGNRDFLPANSVSKSETQEPLSDKPACVSVPAAEVARVQDYPSPQPIPEEMLCGWWRMSNIEEMQNLIKAFHSRGIRERVLQKQIQKHLEYMDESSADNKECGEELEEQEVSKETECWCTEEQAMEVDIGMLQQVETLERKVVSAGLQVKGWMHPAPQSEREDLVYHEQKLLCSSSPNGAHEDNSQKELPSSVVRQPNNPLDIAVIRLAELERNIEQREEEGAPGFKLWRKALTEVRSSAQLSLCIEQLQKSINWERSISKLRCHICQKGDKEDLLLLCDGCDKGYHTYCHKPKMSTVPDGEWFCANCALKKSGESQRGGRQQSKAAAGVKKGSELKRNSKPSAQGELSSKEWAANSKRMPKKGTKEFRTRKGDDSATIFQAGHDSQVSCANRAKVVKDNNTNWLTMCRMLLDELEAHPDAWPFLAPVNHKAVPGYRKVIKKPMDFSTIREKLTNNQYPDLDSFVVDVDLVFENCEKFNEDDSDIGRAGHSMRNFFDKRRAELLHY